MNELFWISYGIGCVIAYGRFFGSFIEVFENYKILKPQIAWLRGMSLFACLLSWVMVFIGTIVFFTSKETYFLKYSSRQAKSNYKSRTS